jgi:uncharacterized membrane protein YccC
LRYFAARSELLPALQLALRAAVAAGLALAIAEALDFRYPLYVMISAVIVTDLKASETRKLALPRVVGTLAGGLLGAAINTALPTNLWTISSGILIAIFVINLISAPAAAKLGGYVCALVMMDHGDSPWSYALFRTVDTLLGVAAAIAVSFVPKLMSADSPRIDE